MRFLSDLAGERPYLDLAIGTVEDGWTGVVGDLLANLDEIATVAPATTLDVLAMGERDGRLVCDIVVDPPDPATERLVGNAVAKAVATSETVCIRCGNPGRPRLERPAWPTTRCDDHAPGCSR